MFRWATRTKPGRVVYFSSSAAYPVGIQQRDFRVQLIERDIDLAHPRLPDSTYGWAKLTGEQLAVHARAAGVPVTVLRPFSGYGADQALDYPFPKFIQRAANRQDPFEVWGDGTQTRDWVHIDDIVATTLACVAGNIDGPLNIGTGRATTFAELAAIVIRAVGYHPDIKYHPDAPTGVHYRVADPSKLNAIHAPTISLEDGVERALRLATHC